MGIIKKYKWWIIVYIIWFSITYLSCFDHGNSWHRYKNQFLITCNIIIPLVIYIVYYIYKNFRKKSNSSYLREEVYSLVEFSKLYGKLQIKTGVNNNNEIVIEECRFIKDNKETIIYVANILKHYSAEDISKNKDTLEVRKLESGSYCLCKKWQDINLEL